MSGESLRRDNHAKPETANIVVPSVLLHGLDERHRRREHQLKMLLRFDPVARAFDEILAHYGALAEMTKLDPEIIHLLEDAHVWVLNGVDHLLSESDPHIVEESRKLLELEYLLLEFASNPERLDEWKEVPAWRRNNVFGFGILRRREEKRQGLDENSVVASRDYWIIHSTSSHPKPLMDVKAANPDPSSSLLNSLGDLLDHAWSALVAAISYLDAKEIAIPSGFADLPIDAYRQSSTRIREVLYPQVTKEQFDALRMPRAKKK